MLESHVLPFEALQNRLYEYLTGTVNGGMENPWLAASDRYTTCPEGNPLTFPLSD
jgi:hypothetical protein